MSTLDHVPCGKDCPNRTQTCHSECEKWAAYEAERNAIYDKRRNASGANAFLGATYRDRRRKYLRQTGRTK